MAAPPIPDDILLRVLARLLAHDPGALDATGHHLVWHWADALHESQDFDWTAGTTSGASSLDLHQSILLVDEIAPYVTDLSARQLLVTQSGMLYGNQAVELAREGRIPAEAFDQVTILERASASGTSLLEAARALFEARRGQSLRPADPELDDVVEPEWATFLASACPPDVATHLGWFFHTPDDARYSGRCFDEGADESTTIPSALRELLEGVEILATWWGGEGQSELALVRVPELPSRPVPLYLGETLVRKPLVSREPVDTSFLQHPREALADAAPRERFVGYVHHKLDDSTLDEVMAELASTGQALPVANLGGQLCNQGWTREALVLLRGMRPHTKGSDRVLLEMNRSIAWGNLNHFDQAYEAATEALDAFGEFGSPHVPEWHLHKNAAWFAYKAGLAEAGRPHIRKALSMNPQDPLTHAVVGAFAMAEGDLDAAESAFTTCMAAGVDPGIDLPISRTTLYRRLALQFRVPVEWTPEELGESAV